MITLTVLVDTDDREIAEQVAQVIRVAFELTQVNVTVTVEP